MHLLTIAVIMMLKLAENIREEISLRSSGKDHMHEMMNSNSFELNMIQYLIDPITVAEASIKYLTEIKNKSTLEAVGLIRKRANFFSIFNMCDQLATTTLQMQATQKLCLNRHSDRL